MIVKLEWWLSIIKFSKQKLGPVTVVVNHFPSHDYVGGLVKSCNKLCILFGFLLCRHLNVVKVSSLLLTQSPVYVTGVARHKI